MDSPRRLPDRSGSARGGVAAGVRQPPFLTLSPHMNFGRALECLKRGSLVTREGWNGKGMFLFLVPGSTFKVNRAPLLGIYPEGTEIHYHAHIDMRTAQGQIVPWLASQSDVLAEDWEECANPQQ